MALEQDIANLVQAANDLTGVVDGRIQSYEDLRASIHQRVDDLTGVVDSGIQSYEDLRASIHKPNPVTLEVGEGKQFEHPADAAAHINSHGMAGDVHWRVVIDPGIYHFPHNGVEGCYFHHNKQVAMTSSTSTAADVILQSNSEQEVWLVHAEHNCHLDVSHINFQDSRELTPTRVDAIINRNRLNNNAGGWVHGVVVSRGSTLGITHCQFNHIWHSIHATHNSQASIDRCIGTNIINGAYASRTGYVRMVRCQWTGIGDPANTWRKGDGVVVTRDSALEAQGNTIKNFFRGITCEWNSDAHFDRFHRWGGDDGKTPVDIINGRIENCNTGVWVWHNSGGHFYNLSIVNSQSDAFVCGMSSSVHAHHGVTIDGARIGFHSAHQGSLVANDSIVKNCRQSGFHASYLSEIHALSTLARVSGNANNYSPATSHTPGNHGAQIYIN